MWESDGSVGESRVVVLVSRGEMEVADAKAVTRGRKDY